MDKTAFVLGSHSTDDTPETFGFMVPSHLSVRHCPTLQNFLSPSQEERADASGLEGEASGHRGPNTGPRIVWFSVTANQGIMLKIRSQPPRPKVELLIHRSEQKPRNLYF